MSMKDIELRHKEMCKEGILLKDLADKNQLFVINNEQTTYIQDAEDANIFSNRTNRFMLRDTDDLLERTVWEYTDENKKVYTADDILFIFEAVDGTERVPKSIKLDDIFIGYVMGEYNLIYSGVSTFKLHSEIFRRLYMSMDDVDVRITNKKKYLEETIEEIDELKERRRELFKAVSINNEKFDKFSSEVLNDIDYF